MDSQEDQGILVMFRSQSICHWLWVFFGGMLLLGNGIVSLHLCWHQKLWFVGKAAALYPLCMWSVWMYTVSRGYNIHANSSCDTRLCDSWQGHRPGKLFPRFVIFLYWKQFQTCSLLYLLKQHHIQSTSWGRQCRELPFEGTVSAEKQHLCIHPQMKPHTLHLAAAADGCTGVSYWSKISCPCVVMYLRAVYHCCASHLTGSWIHMGPPSHCRYQTKVCFGLAVCPVICNIGKVYQVKLRFSKSSLLVCRFETDWQSTVVQYGVLHVYTLLHVEESIHRVKLRFSKYTQRLSIRGGGCSSPVWAANDWSAVWQCQMAACTS